MLFSKSWTKENYYDNYYLYWQPQEYDEVKHFKKHTFSVVIKRYTSSKTVL